MGLFSFFKRDKKKKQTEAELEAQYAEELAPTTADVEVVKEAAEAQAAPAEPEPEPVQEAEVVEEAQPEPEPVQEAEPEQEAEAVEEVQPEPEPVQEAKPEPEPEPELEPEREAEVVEEAQPEPEPVQEAKPEPEPEAEFVEKAQPEPVEEPEPEREPEPEQEAEAVEEAQPEPEPVQQTEPEPAPVQQAQPKPQPAPAESGGFFGKLKKAVSKTRMVFNRRVATIFGLGQKIDDDILDDLEDALIESDMGVATTDMLIEDLRAAWKAAEIETTDDIFPFLKADLKHRLGTGSANLVRAKSGPTVILVVGVNGAGKTTSIAKMARIFVRENQRVLLAAGDTFRAAAVEQLVTWSQRIGCDIVTERQGIDPASVAYQAAEKARNENYDVLLIDTAGRLHTQKNLMDELNKIYRVIQKVIPEAPHETIMVLDATTGQNAINQAKMFKEAANVSGIFLAKLDGTAKGGAVLTINREVNLPVKFVGLGETFEDVQRFNASAFVDALFDEAELEETLAEE